MEVLDSSTGKPVATPTAEAAEAAIRSGKYTFADGQKVGIRTAEGAIKQVDATEAMEALHKGSASLVSDEALRRHALQEEHGGFVGGLEAVGEGAARGVSLGLSDPLAIGAGRLLGGDETAEAVRKHLAETKEANPYLSGGAELAGAAAPILASGGLGAAAEGAEAAEGASALVRGVRAAGVLPRATAALGHGVESAGRALLGEGAEGLAGRVLQQALPKAAAGAAEGAIYGGGSAISEEALNGGDHELTAEQLLASMGHGALFGSLLGGGLGAGGEIASTAAGAALRRLSGAAEGLEGETGDRLSGFLKDQAEKQGWRALSPGKALTERAERQAGGVNNVGRTLLDEGVFDAKTLRESARTPSDLLPRVEEAKSRIGAQLGDIIEKSTGTVRAGELLRPIDEEIAKHGSIAGNEGIVGHLTQYRESLASKIGLSDLSKSMRALDELQATMPQANLSAEREKLLQAFNDTQVPIQDVYKQRRGLDDKIYGEVKSLDPNRIVQSLRDFNAHVRGLELESVEAAGGPSSAEFKALRSKYQHLTLAKEALDKTGAAYMTNRNISASGYGVGIAAAASGHGLLAIPAAIAHQIIKERGNAVAANFLNRISALGTLEHASQSIEQQIRGSLRGYISRTAEAVEQASIPLAVRVGQGRSDRSLRDSYDRRAEQVQAMADPAALQQHLAANMGNMAEHAPKVAAAVATKAAILASYLVSQLPKQPASTSLLQPQLNGPPPSDAVMAAFLRKDAVVQRPLSLLSEMKAGRLTQDQVAAVAATSPKVLQKIRQVAAETVAHRKTALPYAKQRGLQTLLGTPTNATTTPAFVGEMQRSYANEPPPGQPQHHGHGGGHRALRSGAKVGIADRSMTDVERTAAS